MKVSVKVVKKDVNNDVYNLITESSGQLVDNALSYFEEDGSKMNIVMKSNKVEIFRESELVLKYSCVENNKSNMYIESEFGNTQLKIFTHKLTVQDNFLLIDYEIISGNETNDRFMISWEFSEEKR